MQVFHLHARRRRAQGAMGLMFLVLGTLGFTFFHTQVVRSPTYVLQSDRNRLRPLTLPAPRGTILDRNGRIIADNVPGYALSLLPAPRDSVRRTLERMAPHLGLTDHQVALLLERQRRHPEQQLVISSDVSFDRVSAIEERRPLFAEALIEMRPRRHYPAGGATAHVVGYVGEISRDELEDSVFAGYRPGRIVGQAGVERQYEARLGGEPGVRYVEVDALGRIVAEFDGPGERPAVPGDAVRLTLDLDLQEWLQRIVPDTARGAVVALEPETGEVLALYSSPTFDPNTLVGTVPQERWDALRRDTAKPLLNRAISGLYPPGSTWKLATAAIALELGIIEPEETLPLACRGGMRYGARYFRCWEPTGHGYVDLADALKYSCDVYFYQVGLQIGLARLLEEGLKLGFHRPTGVDLPGERAGHFPPETEWFTRRFGWAPTEAEVLSMSIGQGPNDQSALKMAQFFAAVATDGSAPAPRVLQDAPAAAVGKPLELNVGAEHLEALREGMRRVVRREGTAYGSALEHWDWAGKTGTSQNSHGKDHGWFVGVAGEPGGGPEVVVAAIIEEGEHGSDVAQIAAKAADYYLRKTHGMPIDTIQTLREHWQAGRYAPWAARWR